MVSVGFVEEYEKVVKYSGIKVEPKILLIIGASLALAGIALSLALRDMLYLVVLLVAADLISMYPYFVGRKKINEVEENLSEALRQMASVLRSGGTFEVAVREIAASDYGELSKEFTRMLREMEGGKSFVMALESMAYRVNSPLLERVAVIIADSVRTGGRVADVLDDIAEDVRKFYQLRKERRAKTTMQFMFLAVSAAVLGPFLMGVAIGIAKYMTVIGEQLVAQGTLSPTEFQQKVQAISFLELVMSVFVVIESILAAFVGAAMREGRVEQGIIYAPIFLLLAYLTFTAGKGVVHLLIR